MRSLADGRRAERAAFDARVLETVRSLGEPDIRAVCAAMRLDIGSRGAQVRGALKRLTHRGQLTPRHVDGGVRARCFYRVR